MTHYEVQTLDPWESYPTVYDRQNVVLEPREEDGSFLGETLEG